VNPAVAVAQQGLTSPYGQADEDGDGSEGGGKLGPNRGDVIDRLEGRNLPPLRFRIGTWAAGFSSRRFALTAQPSIGRGVTIVQPLMRPPNISQTRA
jgi:hypothetical protein